MAVKLVVNGLTSLATPFVQPIFVVFLYWMIQSLGTISSFWEKGDRNLDEQSLSNLQEPGTYDFIVVGSGSAGAIVANRLCRQNDYKVLLLEFGGDANPLQFIPGFATLLFNYPETDWMHRTVPQKFGSLNSVNQQSSWSAGKVLGGTGTLNLMVHLRGHKKDFENWAKLTGDPEWSWDGVLPFFKSYEDYEIPGDTVNHGYGGNLRIEAPDHIGLAPEFIRAAQELGYPNVDLNAPFEEGFEVIRYPIKNGVRQATYKAFIEPIRTHKRLTIMKYAHVNKVLFKGGNIAHGVQFDRHGKTLTAYATREVILSAGTMGSPKILMLSGIGPRSHLEELNIPVVQDLPVGLNLQDHIAAILGPFFINQPRSTYLDRDATPSAVVKWFTTGRGQLSSTGAQASGLIASQLAKARGQGGWPDLHIFLFAFTLHRTGAGDLARVYNIKKDEMVKYFADAIGKDSVFAFVSGARPGSRGYLKLGGSSPYDAPIIDPNYLGDSENDDLKVLLEGVKFSMTMMENTTAFGGELGAKFTTTKLPGCEEHAFRSDAYWICFIKRFTLTLHHPVGTASMGQVVDTQLRVLGIQNLRVIDASVQPVIVTTNTQASAMMIGEKGAYMLLEKWNKIRKQEKLLQK